MKNLRLLRVEGSRIIQIFHFGKTGEAKQGSTTKENKSKAQKKRKTINSNKKR